MRWGREALPREHQTERGYQQHHYRKERACVAPHHLEPVTAAENTRRSRAEHQAALDARRRTHCKHGHEFTPENTIWLRDGRQCRTCHRRVNLESWHRRQARKRGAVAHIGEGWRRCEPRAGGCGKREQLSEYELRVLLPESRRSA